MARKKAAASASTAQTVSTSTDDLLLAALERGGDATKTGRFLMTFKEGATAAGIRSLSQRRLWQSPPLCWNDHTLNLPKPRLLPS